MSESLTETCARDGHDDSISGEVDEVAIQFLKELDASDDAKAVLFRYCQLDPGRASVFRALAAARHVLVMSEPVANDGEEHNGQLGDFRIVREIARGGMGAIYEAVQEPFQRRVAVKTIRSDRRHVAAGARERFLREQEVRARLHHTHIVPIHAGGQDGDLEYFAMPYIEGAALHHVVRSAKDHGTTKPSEETPSLAELAQGASRSSPLPGSGDPSEETTPLETARAVTRARGPAKMILSAKYLRSVAKVMADAGDALHHAHLAGVIHRDVKPSNIMVDKDEHCWVLDFGLAAYHAAQNGQDRGDGAGGSVDGAASGIMGTPRYMAPEQFQEWADARTDVWGLGVTLYELLTLRPAFATRAKTESGELPSTADSVSNLPRDLEAICLKALRKDPDQRYATAREFACDLRRWLAREPVHARRAHTLRRLVLWSRRNPGWSAAAVLCLALLLAASGGAVALEAARVAIAEAKSKASNADAEAARQQTRARDRDLLMLRIQQLRLTPKKINWFRDLWTKVVEAAGLRPDSALREQAAASLPGLDGRSAKSFPFGAAQLVYDSTGERLLIGGIVKPDPIRLERMPARIWNTKSLQFEELVLSTNGPIAFQDGLPVELHVDGKGGLVMRNLRSGTVLQSFEIPTVYKLNENGPATISTDGVLAGVGLDGPDNRAALAICDARTGVLKRLIPGRFDALSISPDKTFAAAGSQDGHVKVWSLNDGREVVGFEDGWNTVHCLSWGRNPMHPVNEKVDAPDSGWLLAAGDAGGHVRVWDVKRKILRAICPGSSFDVYAVEFSPDGVTLASCGRDEIRLWDLWSSRLLLEIPFASQETSLAFARDGRSLAAASYPSFTKGAVTLFDLDDGHGARTLRGLVGKIMKTIYSPDNELVAALSMDWRVAIWERRTGRLLRLLDVPQGDFADSAGLAISHDHKRFAFSAGEESRLWNIATGRMERSWKHHPGLGNCMTFLGPNQVLLIRFETRQGDQMPGGGADPLKAPRVIRCYKLSQTSAVKPIAEIIDFALDVRHVALSADGRLLVVMGTGCGLDEKARLPLIDENNRPLNAHRMVSAYDPQSATRLWSYTFPRSENPDVGVRLDPTGTTLFVVYHINGQTFPELRNARTGAVLPEHVNVSELGPDARLWSTDKATIFERGRSEPLVTLDPDSTRSGLENGFSSDGRLFTYGTRDGTVLVFDLDEVQRRLAAVGLGW